MQSRLLVASAIAATALLAAACGSTNQSTASASPSPSPAAASPSPSPAAAQATIAVATNAKLGQILVDGSGMTVYLFVADTGTSSTCYASCAQFWPPVLTTGAPKAGAGAQASLLGTTARTDGTTQVTYSGHPLYHYLKDKQSGDTTGQGVNGSGGLWWVMGPSGAAMH
jgi:predicted lipoprotein with Yx(FWY)xxD motif